MIVSASRWNARRLARGRTAALLLIVAIVVGAAARTAIATVSPIFASDTFQTLLIARSLADGHGFASGGAEHPDLSRTVLLPMTIAAVASVTGDVELSARAVVLGAGALIVVPLFFLARSAFGPRAALATLPLGALSCAAGASSRLLATSLFVLIALSAIAVAWFAAHRSSRRWWAVAGLLTALAALTRPEGIALPLALAAWAVCGATRSRRGVRSMVRERLLGAAVVLAAFAVAYAPYVAWVSQRLGRVVVSPGIEYVRAERRVSDHLLLREVASPVPWASRARFMLTVDHRALFLETYFLTGAFPLPDPDVVPPPSGPAATRQPSLPAEMSTWVLRRRWNILKGNLLLAPRKAAWAHFLPHVVVGLGILGLATALRSARGRKACLLLGFALFAALTPFASHIEDRFFYLPFTLGLVVSAAGWGALAGGLSRVQRSSKAASAVRFAAHAALAGAVALSASRHEGNRAEAIARAEFLNESASDLRATLAPGPVLAVEPHFPYLAGRPYRPLPFASRQGILDYAKSQGASALVVEGRRDLSGRPDLAWLAAEGPDSKFQLVRSVPHPSGGDLLIFELRLGER